MSLRPLDHTRPPSPSMMCHPLHKPPTLIAPPPPSHVVSPAPPCDHGLGVAPSLPLPCGRCVGVGARDLPEGGGRRRETSTPSPQNGDRGDHLGGREGVNESQSFGREGHTTVGRARQGRGLNIQSGVF